MHGNAENDEGSIEERDWYERDRYADEDAATARRSPVAPDRETAGARAAAADADPDVFLDVPVLKVDEIDLDVEDLRAHVSLQAEVLDLLKLNVGADVTLGRVHLGISGVEAQAQLRVRLDNVATIINRVLTTLDRNPEILHELARGVGSAVRDVGGGAGQAVGELGTGAARAVEEVGQGAGTAVQDVGRGVGSVAKDVGQGAGRAVQDVGRGAGRAVEDLGDETGQAVARVGRDVGDTTRSVGEKAADLTEAAGETARESGRARADAPEAAPDLPEERGGVARRTESAEGSTAREPAEGDRDRIDRRSEGGTRERRVRAEDGRLPPRPKRRRAAEEREEPP
ncbi:hypothetical protein [Streptomyces chromofuscus]|uniref:Uncharacterized protein n=1 Tax=Streptomyces chromofuscus TaxID=42881 RepID=A0A7M2TAS5_STRCW|nr:hypothetical protein [Streptomyces chromofuscus]QOV44828.1 hypothetical protein IPT68_02075 [Streptomyces chromofuscus]GGS99900.1 hypothetical protein GCM10010254_19900 [Streptomyces chromofuscus]